MQPIVFKYLLIFGPYYSYVCVWHVTLDRPRNTMPMILTINADIYIISWWYVRHTEKADNELERRRSTTARLLIKRHRARKRAWISKMIEDDAAPLSQIIIIRLRLAKMIVNSVFRVCATMCQSGFCRDNLTARSMILRLFYSRAGCPGSMINCNWRAWVQRRRSGEGNGWM